VRQGLLFEFITSSYLLNLPRQSQVKLADQPRTNNTANTTARQLHSITAATAVIILWIARILLDDIASSLIRTRTRDFDSNFKRDLRQGNEWPASLQSATTPWLSPIFVLQPGVNSDKRAPSHPRYAASLSRMTIIFETAKLLKQRKTVISFVPILFE
jgi:hypothetical protein